MICEGPCGPARHSPANMLEPRTGSRLRAPAAFNYVDSRSRPPGFDAVMYAFDLADSPVASSAGHGRVG